MRNRILFGVLLFIGVFIIIENRQIDCAFAETAGLYEYEVIEDESVDEVTVAITKYNGAEENIVIPSVLDGKNVTKIKADAFRKAVMTSVVVPEGITYIGDYSFMGCSNLIDVSLPDSLEELDNDVFYYCKKLESITIPKNVNWVADNCFEDCDNLREIIVDRENKTYFSVDGALYEREYGETFLRIAPKTIEAFSVPEGTTVVGGDAFEGCHKLTSIDIPESITYMQTRAFYGCENLENIKVADENQQYTSENGVIYNKDKTKVTHVAEGIKEINLPEGVTDIGDPSDVFKNCNNLINITLPSSLRRTGHNCFRLCDKLRGITISDGIEEISGVFTFTDCKNLRSLELPGSLKKIYMDCFSTFENIRCLIVPASVTEIGSDSFIELNPDVNVYVESGSYAEAFFEGMGYNVITTGLIQTESVSISQEQAKMKSGETLTLNYSIVPENVDYKELTWASTDESVATVTEEGVVTACGAGTTKIIGTTIDGTNKTVTCLVAVDGGKKPEETDKCKNGHSFGEWTITKEATVLAEGERTRKCNNCGKIETEIIPKLSNTLPDDKTSDKDNTSGNNTNTQNPTGNKDTASATKVTSIAITADSNKIAAGKKVALTVEVAPENATDKSITWASDNPEYATVSADGVVTTLKAGAGKTVKITATANDGSGVTASYNITIMKNAVTKVKITTKAKTAKTGKKLKLKTSIKTNGKKANKTLKWTSSNTKYATVSSKGVVTFKKAGKGKTVKITVMATDGSGKKATIKIKIK